MEKIREIDVFIKINEWLIDHGSRLNDEIDIERHKKRIDELLDKRLKLMEKEIKISKKNYENKIQT